MEEADQATMMEETVGYGGSEVEGSEAEIVGHGARWYAAAKKTPQSGPSVSNLTHLPNQYRDGTSAAGKSTPRADSGGTDVLEHSILELNARNDAVPQSSMLRELPNTVSVTVTSLNHQRKQ